MLVQLQNLMILFQNINFVELLQSQFLFTFVDPSADFYSHHHQNSNSAVSTWKGQGHYNGSLWFLTWSWFWCCSCWCWLASPTPTPTTPSSSSSPSSSSPSWLQCDVPGSARGSGGHYYGNQPPADSSWSSVGKRVPGVETLCVDNVSLPMLRCASK